MAYSTVGIINLAMARIGEGAIASTTGTDTKSILAAQVWDYCLDEVLAEHNWNFAIKRYDLAQDGTAPESGYDYRYALPSDCIKVIDIYPPITDYRIEGGYLLTYYDNSDGNDLTLRYIRRENNPALYSSAFINCLAFRLAAEMAFKLVRGSSNVQDRMANLYAQAIIRAKGVNQAENYLEDETGSTSWIDAGR